MINDVTSFYVEWTLIVNELEIYTRSLSKWERRFSAFWIKTWHKENMILERWVSYEADSSGKRLEVNYSGRGCST